MKSIVVLLVILSTVAVCWAQVGSLGGISRGPGASIGIPVIQPFGLSTSILDSAANLFIFDVSYSYSRDPVITTEPQSLLPRITVTAKTHVTVITNTGTPLKPVDFDGNLRSSAPAGKRFMRSPIRTRMDQPSWRPAASWH